MIWQLAVALVVTKVGEFVLTLAAGAALFWWIRRRIKKVLSK